MQMSNSADEHFYDLNKSMLSRVHLGKVQKDKNVIHQILTLFSVCHSGHFVTLVIFSFAIFCLCSPRNFVTSTSKSSNGERIDE